MNLKRYRDAVVKEGISVSTLGLGLGYNEDLMSGLASAGSGNHIFVEEEDNLVAVGTQEHSQLSASIFDRFVTSSSQRMAAGRVAVMLGQEWRHRLEDARRHVVGGPVGTVHHDLQATQAET